MSALCSGCDSRHDAEDCPWRDALDTADDRRKAAKEDGFVTAALVITVSTVAAVVIGAVSFAAGTNVVKTVPVPGPTITTTATATVEVTRTPRATRDKPRPTTTPRGVERRVTTSRTAPDALGATSPSVGGGREESPLTGWKLDYWRKGQAWAHTARVKAVIHCESGNRPGAVSKTGKYRGLYQFDANKWASYGGLELAPTADRATRAEQNYVGYRVYVGNGWSPWTCA